MSKIEINIMLLKRIKENLEGWEESLSWYPGVDDTQLVEDIKSIGELIDKGRIG